MKYVFFYNLVFLLCTSCTWRQPTLQSGDPDLKLVNGVLYQNTSIFKGCVVDYYPNGQLKSRTTYYNGRKQGLERFWHSNALLAVERFYENGVKVGRHRGWFGNGHIQFDYYFNADGRYHGSHKEWYPSGQLAKHFNFDNGRETLAQRLWKTDGSIKANYVVKNGERFGLIGLKKCNALTVNTTILR